MSKKEAKKKTVVCEPIQPQKLSNRDVVMAQLQTYHNNVKTVMERSTITTIEDAICAFRNYLYVHWDESKTDNENIKLFCYDITRVTVFNIEAIKTELAAVAATITEIRADIFKDRDNRKNLILLGNQLSAITTTKAYQNLVGRNYLQNIVALGLLLHCVDPSARTYVDAVLVKNHYFNASLGEYHRNYYFIFSSLMYQLRDTISDLLTQRKSWLQEYYRHLQTIERHVDDSIDSIVSEEMRAKIRKMSLDQPIKLIPDQK